MPKGLRFAKKSFSSLKIKQIEAELLFIAGKEISDSQTGLLVEMDTFYPVADPPANMLDKIYPATGPFIGERARRPCPFIENHLQNREHFAGAAPV